MAGESCIEWTDWTWNPVTGCTKVSQGCKHCYAERMAHRLQAMGASRYSKGFSLALHHDLVDAPRKWKSPRRIFVNSMSDLFHEGVPLEFIRRVFETMADCPQHVFQVLTKRSSRMLEMAPHLPLTKNVWLGVSVENLAVSDRVSDLVKVPVAVRFLSCEPLLGPLNDLDITGVDWVIAGGESGPNSRPMDPDWARGLRDLCLRQKVPFFFKQWGGSNKKAAGRILDGRTWDEYPDNKQPTRIVA